MLSTALLLAAACLTSSVASAWDSADVSRAPINPFRPAADQLDELLNSQAQLDQLDPTARPSDVSLLTDIERQLKAGSNSTAVLSRQRRALAFPTGSYVQLDLQLYVPFYTAGDFTAILDWTTSFRLRLPNETSSLSIGRSSLDNDREKIYNIIESMMYSFGVDGRVCLLRTICDVAEQPFRDEGVLGDVLNTVMAASYRWQDEKMYDYVEAEYYGRYYGNCQEAYNCPVSMSRVAEVMAETVG